MADRNRDKDPYDSPQGVRTRRSMDRGSGRGRNYGGGYGGGGSGEGVVIALTVLLILVIAVVIAVIVYVFTAYFSSGKEDDSAVEETTAAVTEVSGTGEGLIYETDAYGNIIIDPDSLAADDTLNDDEKRLLGIKYSLESGNSVLQTMRKYYPEDIVFYKDNRYIFIPRDDTLKKHDYSSSDVSVLSTGEYVYSGMATQKGIDVSSHQGDIDWEKAADTGLDFVFIRALYRGYGSGKLVADEKFTANLEGAMDNGVKAGAYIFTQALNETEVDEEIALLKEQLGGVSPDLPVAVDVEEANGGEGRMDKLSREERTELIKYYCEELTEAGYTPMIYFNLTGALLLVDLEELEDYEKWFAVYDTDFYYPYAYTVWQYADTGSVDGIEGDVDLDLYFGEF